MHLLSPHFTLLQGSEDTNRCLSLVPDLSTIFTLSPVRSDTLASTCLSCWRSWLPGVCCTNIKLIRGMSCFCSLLDLFLTFSLGSCLFFIFLYQFSLCVNFL